MVKELFIVGKRLPRPDAVNKATGSTRYAIDISLPGMLTARVLTSPYPHARIVSIDATRARRLPGVEAVITVNDVSPNAFNAAVLNNVRPVPMRKELQDQHILTDKARFVGDAVAAVAAINESIARKALELIRVEYEPLPAALDTVQATRNEAARIHEFADKNIADRMPYPYTAGSVQQGFQEADYTIEQTFQTSKQKHCNMEPTACIASFGPDGRLTVWSQSQVMHVAKKEIATLFDIPEGNIRWLTPFVGGGFGKNLSLHAEPICVALAQKTGRPVKLVDSREDDFITRDSRHPVTIKGKIGVKQDGTITALETRIIADAGAYFTASGGVTSLVLGKFFGLYRCPNIKGEAEIVYTNTPVSGGFRGYGEPQSMFALEQLIDMAAEKIGMDPMEFRLKNIRRTGEASDPPTIKIENSALDECIKIGAQRIGWLEKRAARSPGTIRRGVGMACNTHVSCAQSGLLEYSNALVKMNVDGSANVVVSPCDPGTGILATLSQIAAEELGTRIEDIHMVTGDTDITEFDIGTHASRSTYVIGNAVQRAARQARDQILERAGKALGVTSGEMDVRNGEIYVKASPGQRMTIAEVTRKAAYDFQGGCYNITGHCSFVPQKSPPFQAVFAEVEIDIQTAVVRVLRLIIAADIGRAINPMTVEGQFEGGTVQGLGYALTEDFIIDKISGSILTDNFSTYKIPSTLDIPDIEVILVEHPVASGPFGAKGLGELSIIGIAPAIANAIYNAVGVRITELPITPEKIFAAMSR